MKARRAAATMRPATYVHEAAITGMTPQELSRRYPEAIVSPCIVGGVGGGLVVLRGNVDMRQEFTGHGRALRSFHIYRRFEE